MRKMTLSQAIALKLQECRSCYDAIPFHRNPVSVSDLPASSSGLLQPDELA